jgi:uncharacterized protein (TIGR03437 family)
MMSPRTKRLAKVLLILSVIPVVIHGYEFGPDPGYTGAPGDNKSACIASGCHVGTPNSGPGNVKILLPGGNSGTYVPGQTMQLLVQITDSTKRAYGFEMTARLASNPSGKQAGDFNPVDTNTQVICPDGSMKTGSACPSAFPIEFIEHNLTGFNASFNSSGTFTYKVNWTPPASVSAGNVTLYVAANCGIGNPPVVSPTNVYTANLTLTPAASANTPTITNVLNAATFQGTLAPNTYAAIFGSNLSTTMPGRAWTGADFTGNSNGTLNMPTSLDGTSVTIGGARAFVNYISPGQINIITPPGVTGTNLPVVVTVNGQPSASFNATIQSLAPSFFAWQPGTSDFGKYLIAQHAADFTNVGKVGLFPGTPANFTTPAKPGETIMLYGTGFGPTSPPISNGIETDKVYALSPTPTVTLGAGAPQPVGFGGLVPPLSQVYQFNITIPPGTPNGDQALVVTVNGTQSFSGLITVQGP